VESGAPKVKRIKILDVPVDAVDPDMAEKAIEELLVNSQANQIVFLSLRGLLRARHDPELMRCLREAALVLPTSLAVVRGAGFLGTGKLSLFNQFEFIIRILSVIEKCQGSVYLLGTRKSLLEIAEVNLMGSFHDIRVVGRFYGFFPRTMEGDIVTAIKKSSPSLLLVGTGVPGRERWLLRHKKEFNPGISLWADNCFEVFAGTEKQVSRKLHSLGLSVLSGIGRKPWRAARIFPYFWYLILLLGYKIFRL
jgi:N-acetylglucosaminyldiphosphoundecaprenol N-acetyl-beta-D-mannosaminyltransferase